MAYTFEYPPAFVSQSPLNIERSGLHSATYQLCHHFFLTRLKLVMKEVLTRPQTQYMMDGMQQELVKYTLTFIFLISHQLWQENVLISHGTCSVLGLNVPSPYFLQELIIGPLSDPEDKDHVAAVARVFVSLEVSERDKLFIQMISGDKFDWWTGEDGNYPCYQDLTNLIASKVYKVSSASN